jgi:CheY-like chemotaxis protein
VAGESFEPVSYSIEDFRGGNETVLVAEDDTTTRCFIRDLLIHFGYNVIVAKDGDDALAKFQPNRTTISLLILDTLMPGKNGREVYDIIKKKHPDIRALFISGYPREIVLSRGLLDTSMAFISKPLYPDKFMMKVGEMIGGMKEDPP